MANLAILSNRKTADYRSPISRHLDAWESLSINYRNGKLGQNWFEDQEAFYSLSDSNEPLPSFRPMVRIPHLQVLMMHEANDLSETSPRPYIVDQHTFKRDEDREKSLQAQWQRSQVNYHALYTTLMSLFSGMCPMQIGYDPNARQGRGSVWCKMRDPRTFHCDPSTDYTLNWSWIIFEDRMHLEEVRQRWPLTSSQVRPRLSGRSVSPMLGDAGYGLDMPSGPMSMIPGMPQHHGIPADNRVRVRWCYCNDYTREKVESKTLPDGAMVPADFAWKYPNGRLVVECEGWTLQDGDNPFPLRMFPIVPFWSTLPLYGVWAVPAIRYSQRLQEVAERLYTGLFENAVRLNNGVWFIDERTGIDAEAFGGMPGEVQIINANSPIPEMRFPQQMPQHMTALPQTLLDKQKELQGFTDARSGKPGAGNISTELFDSSVIRSQGVTQLRGRLNSVAYQRIGELMFYTMLRFQPSQVMSIKTSQGYEQVKWQTTNRPDTFDFELDPSTILPFSQAMLRKMAPELRKAGLLDIHTTLDTLEFPDAEKIASNLEQEMALAALAKTKGSRR
jgi:hypothetical protein